VFLGLPQLEIETAERRTAIARDESRRAEAGSLVALALEHRQAHERLDADRPEAWAMHYFTAATLMTGFGATRGGRDADG